MSDKPLAFDLCSGLGGWAEGLEAEGWDVIRVDIVDMFAETETLKPPNLLLMLQDIRTFHGSQAKRCSLIVASPPCTEYSWMAMPWSRAKQVARALRGDGEFPSGYRGSKTIAELTALFDACFRIQREASEAAGHHIPMVVENVKGAQPWVGRAKGRYGSYFLWGDVETVNGNLVAGVGPLGTRVPFHPPSRMIKRPGRNFHAFENGLGSSPSFNGGEHATRGVKQHGSGAAGFDKALDERRRQATATKNGNDWFGSGENCSRQRRASSTSSARKAASAAIARIPLALSRWIAKCYFPESRT
jgi:hypothetical protein